MFEKIKQYIAQLLFPISCLGCGAENILLCPKCINTIPLRINKSYKLRFCDMIFICANYRHPLINRAIKKAKYQPYAHDLFTSLSWLIITCLYQSKNILASLSQNNFVLVPIPLSKRAYARRGFNQAAIIAQEIAIKYNIPINTNLLIKTVHTQSQAQLPYKQRLINVVNAFSVSDVPCPKNIMLVDDVVTTGKTLEQAAKTLRIAGAQKVWAIVLAKS